MAFSAGWVIGVLLAVLASVVSNLGLNLQVRPRSLSRSPPRNTTATGDVNVPLRSVRVATLLQ
jgi:hypothetical protein